MLKLTYSDGRPVYVNQDLIIKINVGDEGCSYLTMQGLSKDLMVTESPEKIMGMINNLKNN